MQDIGADRFWNKYDNDYLDNKYGYDEEENEEEEK